MKLTNDEAYEFFTKAAGGSSRQWAKRYAKMIAKYEVLVELASTEEEKAFLKGFKSFLNIFNSEGK